MTSLSSMQASGDPLTAMKAAIFLRLANAALCPFMVLGWWIFPRLGVMGAGLSTEESLTTFLSECAAALNEWAGDDRSGQGWGAGALCSTLTLAPGEETRFTRTYTFRIDGFVAQDGTGDNTVNGADLSLLSSSWLRRPGDKGWEPACDISARKDDGIDLDDFAALARQFSTDTGSALKGGDVGWFKRGMMVKPFEDSAFVSNVNEVKIAVSQFGFHIIQTTKLGALSRQVQVAVLERQVTYEQRQATRVQVLRSVTLPYLRPALIGSAAMLLLLGSIGLMVHAHEAVPELATVAAMCGAFAALAAAQKRPILAGLGFGVALAAGFASSSWVAPAALYIAVVAAHFVYAPLRTRQALLFLGVATVIALALGALWPVALFRRAQEAFAQWWALNVRPQPGIGATLRYFLNTSGWFAWPAWPLAAWTPRIFKAWRVLCFVANEWRSFIIAVPGTRWQRARFRLSVSFITGTTGILTCGITRKRRSEVFRSTGSEKRLS